MQRQRRKTAAMVAAGRNADETAIRQWLVTNIAAVLEIDAAAIDVKRPLEEYGLDSMQAVCLSGDLQQWLGRSIPETAVWDYPTIESLCKYLCRARMSA
jgi:acyl carrier protein